LSLWHFLAFLDKFGLKDLSLAVMFIFGYVSAFYTRDVVSAVWAYATATWLGGWLTGCPSHAGIANG